MVMFGLWINIDCLGPSRDVVGFKNVDFKFSSQRMHNFITEWPLSVGESKHNLRVILM